MKSKLFPGGGQRAGRAPAPLLRLRSSLGTAADLRAIAVGSAIRWTGPLRPVGMSLTGGGGGLWTSPRVVEMSSSERGAHRNQRVSSFAKSGYARIRQRA